jgi:D-cysteine desulfhydrase
MMEELATQLEDQPVDVIFFATGSGGTAAGMAVGRALCPFFAKTRLVGYAVCDSPEYFYQHVEHEFEELGLPPTVRQVIEFRDAKARAIFFFFFTAELVQGEGYSLNTPGEVELVRQVARSSGVLLDGAYTGKAVFGFVRDAKDFAGLRCLFVHTGGAYSLFGMPPDVIVQSDLVKDF